MAYLLCRALAYKLLTKQDAPDGGRAKPVEPRGAPFALTQPEMVLQCLRFAAATTMAARPGVAAYA